MDSRFDYKNLEPKIYKKWEKSGFFNPDNLVKKGIVKKNAKKFSMILPPPNATGILHMGHAIVLTVEDIMTRFNRMRGKKTLWLPGTDHAAIATQSKVEKIIYKEEKKSRYDLGRDELLKRIDKFVEDSRKTITKQTKAMGATLDWSREAFTLDDKRSLAVRTAFKRMYDDGLIYRGHRIVNWDPKGQTTISDDEVVHEERDAKLYTFRYGKDVPIPIASTRPETKLGDTAIAVNPADKRYKKYVGQTFKAKFAGEDVELKVVTDKAIDPKFGTGALGVTPAHSMIDWEIAEKNDLPIKQVIDESARMMVGMTGIRGEKTTIARDTIVEWLKKEGLLDKEENIKQNISTAERTGAVVEPLPKTQWFVDVNKKFKIKNSKLKGVKNGQEVTLKKLMQTAVRSGEIKIFPKRFEKTYFHWIDNLRDWCISRQIWYGHRIPVWYRTETGNKQQGTGDICVGVDAPRGTGWKQDPDTLDTWFSSSLWTFSTLGWPKKTKDLETYHPTDVLETAYEILFFWVARMILMTTYNLGEVPFHTVYLHGLVRDEGGKKQSKSLGNAIDPLDMIEKYGTDAVRMSLVIGNPPGNDLKLSEDKIRGYRNFTTKVWNVSRFVLMNYDESLGAKPKYTKADRANMERVKKLKKKVTKDIEEYKFYRAAEDIYHYFWHTFADKIIEDSKERLCGDKPEEKRAAQETLITILKECLTMLHPFAPFVTEEVWGRIPKTKGDEKFLMIQKW